MYKPFCLWKRYICRDRRSTAVRSRLGSDSHNRAVIHSLGAASLPDCPENRRFSSCRTVGEACLHRPARVISNRKARYKSTVATQATPDAPKKTFSVSSLSAHASQTVKACRSGLYFSGGGDWGLQGVLPLLCSLVRFFHKKEMNKKEGGTQGFFCKSNGFVCASRGGCNTSSDTVALRAAASSSPAGEGFGFVRAVALRFSHQIHQNRIVIGVFVIPAAQGGNGKAQGGV